MTGKDIRNAIKGRGLTLQQAADLLEMDRTTLYHKLNDATLDKDFLQNVESKIGIDLGEMAGRIDKNEKAGKGTDTAMRSLTIPLPRKRVAEMAVPFDLDNQDLKAIDKFLELVKSGL